MVTNMSTLVKLGSSEMVTAKGKSEAKLSVDLICLFSLSTD